MQRTFSAKSKTLYKRQSVGGPSFPIYPIKKQVNVCKNRYQFPKFGGIS